MRKRANHAAIITGAEHAQAKGATMKANRLLLPLLSMPLVLLSTGCVADYDQGYAPTYPPGYDSGIGSGAYQQPGDLFGGQDVVAIDVFTEPLTRYGRWVNSRYGRAFQPSAGQDYRPYVNGYWGEDRLWISNDPWGWATDHYGRWGFDEDFGWVWAPGTQWAPSWVAWREDAEQDVNGQNIVGWAPIPPGVSYSIGVGFGSGFGYDNYNSWYAPSWVWVPRSYVYQRGFGGRVLPWNSGRNYWSGSRWNYNSGWNGRPGYNRPGGWGPRAGNGGPIGDRDRYDGDRDGRMGDRDRRPGSVREGARNGDRDGGRDGARDVGRDGVRDGRFENGRPAQRPDGSPVGSRDGRPGFERPDGNRDGGRDGGRDGRFNNGQPGQPPAGGIYGRPGYRAPGTPGAPAIGTDAGRNPDQAPGRFRGRGFDRNTDGVADPGASDGRRGYYGRQDRRQDQSAFPQVYRGVNPALAPSYGNQGSASQGYAGQPNPPRARDGNRFGGGAPAPGNVPPDGSYGGRRGDGGPGGGPGGGFGGGRSALAPQPVQNFTPPPRAEAARQAPPPVRMEAPQPQMQAPRERPEARIKPAERTQDPQ